MERRNREFETRAGEKPLTLEGLAIPYDEPATIGSGDWAYTEYIRSGALDGVELDDICMFLNHDMRSIPLARSPKTMTLAATERGLEFSAELPDTEDGKAVYAAVQRGDITKMSFAFDVVEETWNSETRERSITKLGHVYEVSLVNYPAYESTEVQARNKEKEDDNMFNPIAAGLENKAASRDTHAADEYRSAFLKTLLGQELTDAEKRAYDAAKAEKRNDAFNTLSSSAAVVPTQTLNEVVSQARPLQGLYNEVRLFTVPANLYIPVGTPTDAASWHVEGASVAREALATTGVTFSAYELIKVLSMSAAVRRMEISAFEKYLNQELRNSILDAIGNAIVNGTGSGQPTGILAGITWKTSGTGTNAISVSDALFSPDDLLSLISLLKKGYANGAKFAMSTATMFSYIFPFKDGIGKYIFMDPVDGGSWKIFGFPVVLDDNIASGTILFGNFKYYGVNIPQGVLVETSRDSGFTSGLIDYRALCIADGKVILPDAFTKLTVTTS